MSFIRAIGIMLVLALCLPVLGTFTPSTTATPAQTKPAVASLHPAASPANPTTAAAASLAKPVTVAVTAPATAKPPATTTTAVTVGWPSPAATAAPSAAASHRPPAAAKPASSRVDHAPLPPRQPSAPPRTAARTQSVPSPAPSHQISPSAPKSQHRSTVMVNEHPAKVVVNTRAHWLPAPTSQSRNTSRTSNHDHKETQTYSAHRERSSSPPRERYDSRSDHRAVGQPLTPSSRVISRHDDARHDRNAYSGKTSRNVPPRAGYYQSQDYGRRDYRAGVSQSKRNALMREYRENARRQAEIEREFDGHIPRQLPSRRDRYSDASSGRR